LYCNSPIAFANDLEKVKIQPPGAEFPNARMPICAFEIGAPTFVFWVNIPAAASLVGYQWSAVCTRDSPSKGGVILNGLEAVVNGKCGTLEFAKSSGKIVICLLREYQV
jgi:hypothetical protein